MREIFTKEFAEHTITMITMKMKETRLDLVLSMSSVVNSPRLAR